MCKTIVILELGNYCKYFTFCPSRLASVPFSWYYANCSRCKMLLLFTILALRYKHLELCIFGRK